MNEEELAKMKEDLETAKKAIDLIRAVVTLQSERLDRLEKKLLP